MKKLLILLLIVGCDKNSTEPDIETDSLIGEWEFVQVTYEDEDEIRISYYPNDNQDGFVQKETYTFFSDGSFIDVSTFESSVETKNKIWYTNNLNGLIILNCDSCSTNETNAIWAHFNYSFLDSSEINYLILDPLDNDKLEFKLKKN